MTTSMYILYVGFDYTYIALTQGIISFLASQVWFQAVVCMYVCMNVCMYVCMSGGPVIVFSLVLIFLLIYFATEPHFFFKGYYV